MESTNISNIGEVVTALKNIDMETTSLQSKVKIFGLSLLAFIIVGWVITTRSKSFTFSHLIILVIVLFIHEAGHYAGMYYFGYKNLKMFFIPLFGAAVSGHAFVSVTKESIVYLLGPVPGIILGCGVVMIHFLTQDSLWLYTAKVLIVINLINLMPLYPLDGGRFVFGVLPQYTYRFQWIIQIALISLIFFLALRWSYSGYSLLFGLALSQTRHMHKYNKSASKLLESGIITKRTRRDIISARIAPKVISIVRLEADSASPQHLAQRTWEVWRRVRAERPTQQELIWLFLIYLMSISLAIGILFAYPAIVRN